LELGIRYSLLDIGYLVLGAGVWRNGVPVA